MNYKFPEIHTIDDVLPHIEGRSEFIVAEREFGTVINYVVAYAETFDMTGSDDLGGAIRRECRGIKFYPDGRIAARPFHKFFNVNEREETQMNLIDLSQPHEIMEKADGSMIHGIIVDSEVRLCTKMGITDIAMDAERYLALTPDNVDWLECRCIAGITDLFEWVSPENKIVLDYAEKDLIYLGSRIDITGEYFFDEDAPFTKVARYGSVEGNLADYISKHRADEGREGFIIRFIGGESNGQMFKGKNDWYVRIHKVKDLIRTDRNIAAIIINEELDDVLPILDETDIATVRAYEARFDAALENVLGRLEGLVTLARVLHGGVKKDVAINFVPNLIFKEDASFIFSALDGKDLRTLVIEKIKRDVGNTTKYEKLLHWLEF
jgi:RNA ligase